MLDARFIRENIEIVKKSLYNRNYTLPIDELLKFEEQRRSLLRESEELRNKRNIVSEEIGRLRTKKQDASKLIEEMKSVSDRIKELDDKIKVLDENTDEFLLNIPNIPNEYVPVGKDEAENVEVKRWSEPKQFDLEPLNHWDIGEMLEIIDLERASKIAGARFSLTKGYGAKLERSLMNFMLDLNTSKGYKLGSGRVHIICTASSEEAIPGCAYSRSATIFVRIRNPLRPTTT